MFFYDPLIVLILFTLGMMMVFISLFMPAPSVQAASWGNLIKKGSWTPIWRQKPMFTKTGWRLYLFGWVTIFLAAIVKLVIVLL